MTGMDPRNFRTGTPVEICPFQKNYFHHYYAYLDGERGEVVGPGEDGKIRVRLSGERFPHDFPVRALKLVSDKSSPKQKTEE